MTDGNNIPPLEGVIDDGSFAPQAQTPKMPTIIKVVGVGGGGNNAINHMYSQNIDGVSFVVINTDRQALNMSPVPNRVLIGPTTTHGLGAGNNPGVAAEAAEESSADIAALFDDDTKMVFITAGMGGGTGTGAAPVVARIAHEKGVLTIGIVTIPFIFEGQRKIIKALAGANEMRKYVDALLIINNQQLINIYPDLDFNNAFGKADDTLSTAARSISELITAEGKINLDFKDVNTTLRAGGVAIISTGYGEGENRVTKAINDALNSPLLKNRDVYSSSRILINIYFNPDSDKPFQMSEMNEMQSFMANFSLDVDAITGVAFDHSLDNRIKITILAAGFDLSLTDEAPEPQVKAPVATSSPAKPKEDEESIREMEKLYGEDVIAQSQKDKAAAQYIILTREDIENEALLDELRNHAAYKRLPEVKQRINALRETPQNAPAAQAHTAAQAHAAKPGSTGTIQFE
ncbi:cell division protein FtsZ [Sodaliphilus sp.]|uniref:cell division protein FtsZ n=1 Tax=Sodaliphilus sp. TaxID=2815818 RepID=UPI0038908907